MSYQDALHRLLTLVDYERITGTAKAQPKYDLSRMHHLLALLGNPQSCAPVVHVAGTKGKGSVAAMIASILESAGYKTGLYTSPHLHTFRERIRVGESPVSEGQFTSLLNTLWPHVEDINNNGSYGAITTFELLTAMALLHFRRQRVDVQVMEVGMGGRLDATNVVYGSVCVITPISIDHTAILGDTMEAIAREKAGIIKNGSLVISSPQEEEVSRIITDTCDSRGASVHLAGLDILWHPINHDLTGQAFQVQTPSELYRLWIPMLGLHQVENAAVAVACAEALAEHGFHHIDPQAIVRGLKSTSWSSRLEVLGTNPLIVVDGAHNRQSSSRLAQAIQEYFSYNRLLLVMGCAADKDIDGMAAELVPLVYHAYTAPSLHPKALPAQRVADAFKVRGVTTTTHEDVKMALGSALEMAQSQDLILATGSLFVAAEAIQAVRGITGERYPEMEPCALPAHPIML